MNSYPPTVNCFQKIILLFFILFSVYLKSDTPSPFFEKLGTAQKYQDLVKKAVAGDAEAQWRLGWLYENRKAEKYRKAYNITEDLAKAIDWYQKAAKKNQSEALEALETIFMPQIKKIASSDWVKADFEFFETTKEWSILDEAAYKAFLDEIYKLKDTLEDINIAYEIREYRQLRNHLLWANHLIDCLNDNTTALAWLGDCYYSGRGVKQDYRKATTVYRKAIDKAEAKGQVNYEASSMLGLCYFYGDGVKQNFTIAKGIIKPAIEKDHVAKKIYADLLFHENTEKSRKDALELYLELEKQHPHMSLYHLGLYYKYGLSGITKDQEKARKYFEYAASKNNAEACMEMLQYCQNHQGDDCKYCLSWYYKASKCGSGVASFWLQGYFWKKNDFIRCVKYLRKGAEQGNLEAMLLYGQVLYLGGFRNFDMVTDESEGERWIKTAAEYGYEPAIEYLKKIQ